MEHIDLLQHDERVKALFRRVTTKRKSAIFNAALPYIAEQLSLGVQHEDILQVLRRCGLDINLNTFGVYLYRVRQRDGFDLNKNPFLKGQFNESPEDNNHVQKIEKLAEDLGSHIQNDQELQSSHKPVMPTDIDRILQTPVDLRSFEKAGQDYLRQLTTQEKSS